MGKPQNYKSSGLFSLVKQVADRVGPALASRGLKVIKKTVKRKLFNKNLNKARSYNKESQAVQVKHNAQYNGGGTIKVLKFGRPEPVLSKSMEKRINDALGLTIRLNNQYVNQQQALTGKTNMLPLQEFPNRAELISIMAQIPVPLINAVSGNAGAGTAATHTNFNLTNQVQLTKITSAELSNIHFVAYLFIARKDIPLSETDISTMFQAGFSMNSHTSLTHVNYGSSSAGNSGANSSENPFDSWSWCHYFKCIRVEKKILAPGETIALKIEQLKERYVSGYDLNQGQYIVLKGAMLWLTQITGTPADDAATKLVVGTTGAKINIIQTYSVEAHAVQGKQAIALGNTGSLTLAITAPTIVNPDADVALADASV